MAITGTADGYEPEVADRDLARVRTLAHWMDNKLIDPLMGLLLPGIGDAIGSLVGFYVVMIAWRRRVSPVIIARMILNLGFDLLMGLLPLVGDAVDLKFKANVMNVELLMKRPTGKATAKDWLFVLGAAVLYLAIMGLIIWGVIALLRHL
jgi:hypothetical protein